MARFPAPANSACAEVDVLGVIFVIEQRRQQPYDVHAGQASLLRQVPDKGIVALLLGYQFDEFRDNVTELMHLPLPLDMARDTA
jgi:hypothetical protein